MDIEEGPLGSDHLSIEININHKNEKIEP